MSRYDLVMIFSQRLSFLNSPGPVSSREEYLDHSYLVTERGVVLVSPKKCDNSFLQPWSIQLIAHRLREIHITTGGCTGNGARVANNRVRVVIDHHLSKHTAGGLRSAAHINRAGERHTRSRAANARAGVKRSDLRDFKDIGCDSIQVEKGRYKTTPARPRIRFLHNVGACTLIKGDRLGRRERPVKDI